MAESTAWLPLFPLKTVLFPEGVLPLKVFEARYTDMVRDCMRRDQPFGVVLLKSGLESNPTGEIESTGCIAHITSWDMPQLGVLMLRTRGGLRFRIRETRLLPDKRLEARFITLPQDQAVAPQGRFVACATTLKVIIDDLARKHASGAEMAADSPFTLPIRLNDAGWVADRWCEILPIPLKARQKLLEVEDAESRLEIVFHFLQQHEIL